MKIETKYNIGDTFFAPRCKKVFKQEAITFNGKEYSRQIQDYNPYVKIKKIDLIRISVYINKPPKIEYHISDVDETVSGFLSTRYTEEVVEKYKQFDATTALYYAKLFALEKKEFHGF